MDLILYTITQLQPAFAMAECAPELGGFGGSTFLNKNFLKFLRKRFRGDPEWTKDIFGEVSQSSPAACYPSTNLSSGNKEF